MDKALKQRLIGAAVLIAIAIIFLPPLVNRPAPVSGAANVSLDVPATPQDGFETRELPLGAPGEVPASGVAGMQPAAVEPDAAQAATGASTPASPGVGGGEYAVAFGSYATAADAARIIEALAGLQLQAYAEPTTVAGKPAQRVRIGPFASRADAEAARIKALTLGNNARANVIALDAGATPVQTAAAPAAPVRTAPLPATPAPATATAPAPKPTEPKPQPAPVAAAPKPEPKPAPVVAAPKPEPKPAPVPAPRPAAPAAANTGFAVQLGAFADAAAATALRDRARAAGLSAFTETVNTADGPRTRVRIGPVADREAAERLQAQAQSRLGVGGMVRPHP